jgi:glycosyl hydrolase family 26
MKKVGTRRIASILALLVTTALVALPGTATAADRPVGPLSPPSGAWFGGTVNQNRNDGVNGGMAEINARESFLGRRYDIINRFYAFNVAIPTSLESWDASMGRIPMVTWGAGSDTLDLANGVNDTWLRQQADRFAAFGSPIFLRFYHEPDGAYQSAAVHSATAYIQAWRHVHDIFIQEGATNVVWIWCPTSWSYVTGSPWPPTYYPGDAYVDWIATDGYNWFPKPGTNWRSWTQIFQPFYDWAATMSKPIMIAENGVMEDPAVAGRKAAWIADSQQQLKTSFPLIQAVLYFDTQVTKGGFTYTWPVDTTQASYNAYRTMANDPYFMPTHGAPDMTPPTQPGTPTGVSLSSSTIDLTWGASTDDLGGTIMYRVLRDGAQVGSVSSASTSTVSFTDQGLTAGSTHTYSVVPVDAAGNVGPQSATSAAITVLDAPPPPPSGFADDFSSAGFGSWTGVTRLTIDAGAGGVAAPSARAQVTNQSAWAYKTLSTPVTGTVCMSLRANISTAGSASLVLLRLRTSTDGPVARVTTNASGVLQIRSDVSGTQKSSGVAMGSGWHSIELCGTVGTAGSWDLYRDGVRIVTAWVANTGTTPVGRIQIGDNAAKTVTMNIDDVVVDQHAG